MRFLIFGIQRPQPLGRWFNVGERFSYQYLMNKERLKERRALLREKCEDPYRLLQDEDETDEYMIPYLYDW